VSAASVDEHERDAAGAVARTAASPVEALPLLGQREKSCLQRYLDLLVETLGRELDRVVLFGSVARGESWPAGMPIRSDLDLLVVTDSRLPADLAAALIDATLPLFLECGRQIGPQFRTAEGLAHPTDERAAGFLDEVRMDGICLYRRGDVGGRA
jgi:predicted nucleotidyltransferase